MFNWLSRKGCRFWQLNFFLYTGIIIAETILFAVMFFVFPDNPISEFPSLLALPAKYLVLIVVGGLTKETVMGFFWCYSFKEWQRRKHETS